MPPIIKETDTMTATPEAPARPGSSSVASGDSGVKQQPVALEVPVTVNGARTIDGSAKREPFSETTKTVLVFGSGAVIRLTSSVAPGRAADSGVAVKVSVSLIIGGMGCTLSNQDFAAGPDHRLPADSYLYMFFLSGKGQP